MNWEVVMWILMSVALLLSFVVWCEMLKINPALYGFIDWGFQHFLFMIAIPAIFIALLIGKFW